MINKDTQIFGSFSNEPSNRGCEIFNASFQYHGINAIYKSFKVDCIEDAVRSARSLGFSGFAVSMPFKKEVLKYVDEITDNAIHCCSANTIVRKNGLLVAYNTDYEAAHQFLTLKSVALGTQEKTPIDFCLNDGRKFYVIGGGGYANSVMKALDDLKICYSQIERKNWQEIYKIEESIVYNCTPVQDMNLVLSSKKNALIDCITSTPTGRMLGLMQAAVQYKIYTDKDLPLRDDA